MKLYPKSFLDRIRLVWREFCAAFFAAAILASIAGCAYRGVKVVASTASATNLGDINWEEYKIPVFSIISGPRTTVWINKDYLALKSVHAGGSTTNETSALGIYTDHGGRTNFVDLEFSAQTTSGSAASASQPTPCPAEAASAASTP